MSTNAVHNALSNKNLNQLKASEDNGEADLIELMDVLAPIDLNGPLAKLNKVSISDNNGGRIKLHKNVK